MKEKIILFSLIILLECFMLVCPARAQEEPATWREQLEYARHHLSKSEEDENGLSFINYTYIGIIDSEAVKLAVIDSLFSPHMAFPKIFPPLIISDTVYSENRYTITEKRYPKFEIITIGKALEAYKPLGVENPLEQIRTVLENAIRIGFEYVQLEWDYKGEKIKTLCVVSDEQGGIVYDHIGCLISEGTAISSWYNIPYSY